MIDRINYTHLDNAKNAFIQASRSTLDFAKEFGFCPDSTLGASSNVFQLDLKPFLSALTSRAVSSQGVHQSGSVIGHGASPDSLSITLIPEGLGTADDARPDDLSSDELVGFWHEIGIKTVAVMTNDAASSGMQSILISLYLPSSQPEIVFSKEFMTGFLGGFVDGCRIVKCVYFSGETPQLKTKIYPGQLDIAGAVFGLVPAGLAPIKSSELKVGDYIVMVESSGPHENGYTSLRDLATRLPNGYRTKLPSGTEYWSALNRGSILYTPLIQAILKHGIMPTSIEPISGHGWQKLMRNRENFGYVIEQMLPVPELFGFVQEQSGLSVKEMISTFNYGAGYTIFARTKADADAIVKIAADMPEQNGRKGLRAVVAGQVVDGKGERYVEVKPLGVRLGGDGFTLKK